MSEDLLEALKIDFDEDKYKIKGKGIKIARLDANNLSQRAIAKDIGLRLDEPDKIREPHMVFYYQNEFFHWSHGWLRHDKVKVLHWINRIVYPFTELRTAKQLWTFFKHEKESVESTDFFVSQYPPLGKFYEEAEFKTRVLVLDQDEKELHDAYEAARHLADRHDLRFGFSSEEVVLRAYDKKTGALTHNFERNGAFEALVTVNHQEERVQMGLHPRHNKN